jgi:ParB/RepB/Spo0J family partition protein
MTTALVPEAAATTKGDVTLTGALQEIALDKLTPHPANRKHFDEAQLRELAESLREKGQLTPTLVRPRGRGYELLAGERRWRAAKLAGFAGLLCIVRELNDEAALEVLAIENNQRQDVHPLEEAELYKALLQFTGHDVASVARKLGRSPTYVRERLRLLRLIPKARELMLAGAIPLAHAVLLAGLSPADQKRAINEDDPTNFGAFSVDGLFRRERTLFDDDEEDRKVVVSLAEFRDWIRKCVRFDPKLEVAGELFPETVALVKEAEASNQKVLRLTTDYRADDQVKDPKVRTVGKDHWKRADGTKGSKVCDYAQLGVVVSGEAQGLAFAVCIRKDKCTVHWSAEQKRAARRRQERERRAGTSSDTPPRVLTPAEKAARAEERREQQLAQRIQQHAPALLKRLAAAVAKVRIDPKGERFARLVEAVGSWRVKQSEAVKLLPRGTTPEQLLRHLVWLDVLIDWDIAVGSASELDGVCATLGLTLEKLLDEVAPVTLDERTAFCERCGCTQEQACPGGCGWDPASWKKGKAICTACLAPAAKQAGKKPAKKKLAGDVRRERKAKRATEASGPHSTWADTGWMPV